MPLNIEHPIAAISTGRKYRRYFSNAERIFDFNSQPVDFISNGIILVVMLVYTVELVVMVLLLSIRFNSIERS